MTDLKKIWQETEEFVRENERRIAEKYTNFLREVAKFFLKKGKRVFFKENKVVHYGEGGFGWMIIEGEEENKEVFGDYVPEIRFESTIDEKTVRGYKEITENNIEAIKYEV